MNRRTFVEALAAAVGSLPLLGSLLPTPKPDPLPNPTPSNSFEYLNGTMQAGEYIPAGAAVYTGRDGKLYRVRTGRVDSEGNVILKEDIRREALELERLCHENRVK